MSLWLTKQEVIELTDKQQRQAQLRVLRDMGLDHLVRQRPDGSFVVLRYGFLGESESRSKGYSMDFSGLGSGTAKA